MYEPRIFPSNMGTTKVFFDIKLQRQTQIDMEIRHFSMEKVEKGVHLVSKIPKIDVNCTSVGYGHHYYCPLAYM